MLFLLLVLQLSLFTIKYSVMCYICAFCRFKFFNLLNIMVFLISFNFKEKKTLFQAID